MKKTIFTIGTVILLSVWPAISQAFEVNLESLTEVEGVTVTESNAPDQPPPGINEVQMAYAYQGDPGETQLTAVFSIDDTDEPLDGPPFVLGAGVDIKSLAYAAAEQQFTIIFTIEDFQTIEAGNLNEFQFMFIETVEVSPENPDAQGPPHAMGGGGYVATSVPRFTITPPEGPETPGFGLSMTGPAGATGFFKLYMLPAMMTFMGQMSGRTIEVSDLGVFIDDDQASISIVETDEGGALFDISVVFASGDTSTASSVSADAGVTREIMAKERLPLSLALRQSTIEPKQKARLFGWLKNGKSGQKIKILRKKKGEKKYKEVATVITKADGYFNYNAKHGKAGTFYYKARQVKKGKRTSPMQTLRVST